MNKSLIFGLLGGIGMVVWSIMLSTKAPLMFIHSIAAIIVVGGLFCAALITRPLKDNLNMFVKVWHAAKAPPFNHHILIQEIISIAQKNSQLDLLSYENELKNIKNAMLRESVELVGMGYRAEEIKKLLSLRLEATETSIVSFSSSLLSLAKLCPAFGLLGTLIGLIILLYNMGSGHIEEVGPAMAISLTATLYGVLISNVVLTPLADFMIYFAENTRLQDMMIMEASVMLREKKHYIQILELLKSYIPRHEQDELAKLLRTTAKTRTAGANQSSKPRPKEEMAS